MSPEEAIEKYCGVFRSRPDKKYGVQFRVEGNLIRRAHVDVADGWVQWGMQAVTPEELAKQADMLSLGMSSGDPKKPEKRIFKRNK